MDCGSAEELMKLAKAEGIELTKEEAEAYMDEFACADLDNEQLAKVAGGWNYDCLSNCPRYVKGAGM